MNEFILRAFVKDYRNTSDPAVRRGYGQCAGIVGIATNLLLFAMKLTAALSTHSIAITADAFNSLSDSASSLVALVGFKLSGKPADAQHPYGHARMEYVSGLIVSFLILFFGLQLLKSAAEKIFHPQAQQFGLLAVALLGASILFKLWQSAFYRKAGKAINSVTILAASADSRNDSLASAAVLLCAAVDHWAGVNLDGYMGALVALLILWNGVEIVRDTVSLLIGTAPTREMEEMICKKILGYEHVIGLHDLAVHSYGAGRCFASVHVEVPAERDILLSHDVADNIERDFLKEYGIHLVVHLDPVVTGDERTNALKERVEELLRGMPIPMGMHDFRVVWGVTHSNLIFDVEAPFDSGWKDEKIIEHIAKGISAMDPSYHAVITVDHGGQARTRKPGASN